jgi:RNA polymerase sigma-70 factor (ECF subfamily)
MLPRDIPRGVYDEAQSLGYPVVNAPPQNRSAREEWLQAFEAGRAASAATPATPATLGAKFAAALEESVTAAAAAWPKLVLAPAAFAFHLGRVMEDEAARTEETALATLNSLHVADMFLACAAAANQPAALAEFEARYMKPLPFIMGGVGALPGDADTVLSVLRDKLLISRDGLPPRIATYGGRGPLAAWIAIAAQRTALSLDRHESALHRAHDRAMSEAIAVDLNPELRHMKGLYKEAVETAFRDALGELADRDRALLRLGLVGGLSLDAIGSAYSVNASTVSRWLSKIRKGILDRTLLLLRERLRLSEPEAASIARLVTSQMDVSVVRLL